VLHRKAGSSRRRRRRGRGQALVEFALVFPVFMLVLAGILDFGFMLYSRIQVINAARDGARAAIVLQTRTAPSIHSAVLGQVQGSASGSGLNTGSLTVTELCGPAGSSTNATCDSTNTKSGDSVAVSVTYPYHGFFPQLFGSTITLGASVQMVFE
jgi:Flp pilus assembly protein TadG